MTLNLRLLETDLKELDNGWMRIGVMGDPCFDWDLTIEVCSGVRDYRKTPVVLSRLWVFPDSEQLKRLAKYGSMIHGTVCASDPDAFLASRGEACNTYLGLGGVWVWRVVTFHFDDRTVQGLALWEKQGSLVGGTLGANGTKRSMALEVPARLMRGNRSGNPVWLKGIAEWAYLKAPTTRRHGFSAANHNWTAGVLYPEMNSCWEGCPDCPKQCH